MLLHSSVLLLMIPHGGLLLSTDCRTLQDSDLGNTSMLSTDGLLAEALRAENADIPLQILESNTVCLVQGTIRDMYMSVSLVVRYRIANGTELVVQVEFMCSNNMWGNKNPVPSVTLSPEGNLSTPLRTDCSGCSKPESTSDLASSPEQHCVCKCVTN